MQTCNSIATLCDTVFIVGVTEPAKVVDTFDETLSVLAIICAVAIFEYISEISNCMNN